MYLEGDGPAGSGSIQLAVQGYGVMLEGFVMAPASGEYAFLIDTGTRKGTHSLSSSSAVWAARGMAWGCGCRERRKAGGRAGEGAGWRAGGGRLGWAVVWQDHPPCNYGYAWLASDQLHPWRLRMIRPRCRSTRTWTRTAPATRGAAVR